MTRPCATPRYNATSDGADSNKDDKYANFLLDGAFDGNGAMPYSMTPETEGQDERLTITGLPGGSGSLRLGGMMPVGNWDHYAARQTLTPPIVSDRRWPLFTLSANPTRYVEFLADCENKGFLVRVKDGSGPPVDYQFGVGQQVWLPESPLLVGIGISVTAQGVTLYIGASLGGDAVQVGPATGIPMSPGDPFSTISFRGATGGYSGDGEVCEFRIIGGEFDDSTVLNNTTLLTAFTDLAFLTGP